MSPGAHKLLTIDDLADRWRLSPARVRELVRERPDLPRIDFTALRPGRQGATRPDGSAHTGDRQYRFREADVDAWERDLAHAPPEPEQVPASAEPPGPAAIVRVPGWDGVSRLRQVRPRRASSSSASRSASNSSSSCS